MIFESTAKGNSRTVLGHDKHDQYRLSETRGLVEGIAKIRKAGPLFDRELSEFSHLPIGETVEFYEDTLVEIVEFGAWSYEVDDDAIGTQYKPHLNAYAVNLKTGARLRGPVAWRKAEPRPKEKISLGKEEKTLLSIAIGVIAVIGLVALILDELEGFAVVLAIFSAIIWYHVGGKAWLRLRAIAKNGFLFVMSPGTKSWK